jgi:hypothetical protein
MQKKWEYHLQEIPQIGFAKEVLDDLGQYGWELVAIVGPTYYLKREKVENTIV